MWASHHQVPLETNPAHACCLKVWLLTDLVSSREKKNLCLLVHLLLKKCFGVFFHCRKAVNWFHYLSNRHHIKASPHWMNSSPAAQEKLWLLPSIRSFQMWPSWFVVRCHHHQIKFLVWKFSILGNPESWYENQGKGKRKKRCLG